MDTQPIVSALHAIASVILIWGATLALILVFVGYEIVAALEKRNKEKKGK
jgi:hypothetical protein